MTIMNQQQKSFSPAPASSGRGQAMGAPRGFARVTILLIVAALPMASALFRVWVYQDTVRLGYALSAQQQNREVLLARLHELEVEYGAARSPARLVRMAQKLGLQAPQPGQLVGGSAPSHLARAEVGRNKLGAP